MPGASAVVQSTINQATSLGNSLTGQVGALTAALAATLYTPPTVTLSWNTPPMPGPETLPDMPALPDVPALTAPPTPGALNEALPTVVIDTMTDALPALSFPAAPVVEIGAMPAIPTPRDVALPDVPMIVLPSAPSMLTLNIPAFGGINTHDSWLAKLDDVPQMQLTRPGVLSYQPGERYASELLTQIGGVLLERLRGGTGLAPAVEQAIWDRSREREMRAAMAQVDEARRTMQSLGFVLPPGALAARIRSAQQDAADKISSHGRDVAIKQAELEQENLKTAIAQGIEMERSLIDQAMRIEQLAFEAARAAAQNEVELFNAEVKQYEAQLTAFRTYAEVYKELIAAETAKVEVYKAQLSAEETKAQINTTLVAAYKAAIDAQLAQVELYKGQLSGAQAFMQVEQLRLQAAGEQIKAFSAQVSAEVSKVEIYKAGVAAETSKVGAFEAQTRAFSAKVSAQAEQARANATRFSALAQAKSAEWDGFKAQVSAQASIAQAAASRASVMIDGFKAKATAATAKAEMATKTYEVSLKQYEAGMSSALAQAKINSENIIWAKNAHQEAAKAGMQSLSTLAASAFSIVRAGANLTGEDSTAWHYNANGSVAGDVPWATPSP